VNAGSAAVIGGGFFGAMIALKLKRERYFEHVVLFEREHALLARASRFNQARIHGGYHYPRSFVTAYRSRQNYPRFLADFPSAVLSEVRHFYAIARNHSQISASHFERFAQAIGASLEPADEDLWALFERRLIEQIYAVDEQLFDALKLAAWLTHALEDAGVEVRLEQAVGSLEATSSGALQVMVDQQTALVASRVYNATYAALAQFEPSLMPELKVEAATLLMVDAPAALGARALTVMDGPFFSLLPYPPLDCYSLSHVRYTPSRSGDLSAITARMLRDVKRLAPGLGEIKARQSWTEPKCVLARHEIDDGRPIMLRQSEHHAALWHVLGAKLDNVYDVLDQISS